MTLARGAARFALTFAVLQGAAIGVTYACSCLEPDFTDIRSDEIAFVGEHRGTARIVGCNRPGRGDNINRRSRFEVIHDIGGTQVGDIVEVAHGRDDGSCGVRFGSQPVWTVRAYELDGEWVTSLCAVAPGDRAP